MDYDEYTDWYDLSKYSDNVELPFAPTELWVLNLFVTPLNIDGRIVLPLIYPSYTSTSINGELAESEGIWSTPYAADKLELGPFSPSLVGKIRNLYTDYFLDTNRVDKCVDDSLYHIGLQSLTRQEIGSVIEYKKSPRRGNVWKCYYIRYIYINDLDHISKKNLVDPNCIRGMNFIDAENYEQYTIIDQEKAHKIYYKGRLLSSNLAYMLSNDILSQYLDSSSKVDKSLLTVKEYGVFLSIDMIGFGQLHEDIMENFGSIETTGVQVAHGFLLKLREMFIDLLEKNGFFQYKIEGDGFLATSPLRHFSSDQDVQIGRAIEVLSSLVSLVNDNLKNTDRKPSWRAAILVGEYKYGKISTILSSKAEHIGESLVDIARLLESSREIEDQLTDGEYSVTLKNDEFHNCQTLIDLDTYRLKIERKIEVKEYTSDVITLIFSDK